jgi:cytidylate kinase
MTRFSPGKVFRTIAKEKGIPVLELNKNAQKEVDLEVDRQSKEAGLKGNVVIEGDLAAWVNKEVPNKTVIRIWFSASAEARGERIFNDEKSRISEKYPTIAEATSSVTERDTADRARYIKYYEIDWTPDTDEKTEINHIEYDKVIDTSNLDIEAVKKEVFEFLESKGLKPAETI